MATEYKTSSPELKAELVHKVADARGPESINKRMTAADQTFSKKSLTTSGSNSVTVVYAATDGEFKSQTWRSVATKRHPANKPDLDALFSSASSLSLVFSRTDKTAALSLTFGGFTK